jgi:hypothetical protein
LIVLPPKGALDQIGQLICSAVNGLVQGGCLISDSDRLAAFKTGFHHAAHVINAALFVAVLIAQVDLHSCDVIAESAQSILYYATDVIGQRLVTFDVMVGIDLDLHGVLLL